MFSNELKRLRKANQLTQQQLADQLGLSKSAISMYENGNREPDFETEERMADFFHVDINTLRGLAKWNIGSGIMVPVLGYVRAGIPIEAVEEILDYEEISVAMSRQGEYFGLQIKGDSMEPKFSEGDVVIVRKQEQVENGEIAVVLVNDNDATVKKVYCSANGIKLVSTNPTYDPFFYTPDEVNRLPVQIIGKVVELRAKF